MEIGGDIDKILGGPFILGHPIVFGHSKPMCNRLLGFFANLPLGVPASITFKKYHLDPQDTFQGDEVFDTDVSTRFEVFLFSSRIAKVFFLLIMPLLYSLRPIFIFPKSIHLLELVNLAIILCFDGIMFYFFGGKTVFYFILIAIFGLSIHPISKHYVFNEGYETYSYHFD